MEEALHKQTYSHKQNHNNNNVNFYKHLIEELPIGYAYIKKLNEPSGHFNFVFLEVNAALEKMFKLNRSKIIGKKIFEIIPSIEKNDLDRFTFYLNSATDNNRKEFENYSKVLNKWYKISLYSPEKNYVIMNLIDISREKEQLLELENSRRRMENIIEGTNVGTWELNMETGETNRNERWAEILGYNLHELFQSEGNTWKDLVHPDDLVVELKRDEQLYNREIEYYDDEYRMKHKNGSWVWIQDRGKVISWTQDGKPLLISGTHSDITKRKQDEEALRDSEEKYRMIFENNPLGIIHYNYEGTIINCNENFSKIIGSARLALIGSDILKLFDKEFNSALIKSLKGKQTIYEGVYSKNESGKDTLMRVIFDPILVDNEIVLGGIGIIEDITERKRLEMALANEKNLLKTTLISVGDGVISTDNKGKIVFMNRAAENLTGWTQREAKGKSFEKIFNAINETTGEKSENIIKKALKKNIPDRSNHTILISKDGTERSIENSTAPILQDNGEIVGMVLAFRDCSEKKKKQEEILYLSYCDQLTGLYNRRFFEEEMIRINEEKNLPITIVMADVNGLKLINDSFGHIYGDALLKKVAEVIKRGCRNVDTVCRLGGDEFVILLRKTDTLQAEHIIKRMNILSSTEKIGAIDVSVSFGYETKYSLEDDIQEIFKNAEDNMYRNKLYESSSIRNKTIDLIMNTLYEKSNREMLHSKRVSKICELIAKNMNFDRDKVNQIKIAGLMHDIGKMGIDEKILNKPGSLNSDEWKEMKRHPEIGYRILSSSNEFSEIAEYVLKHHERWDGNGYPGGFKGEEISLQSRIIAVADAYDAMTSDRPYRKGSSVEEAITELKRCAGVQFDKNITNIFIEHVLKKKKSI